MAEYDQVNSFLHYGYVPKKGGGFGFQDRLSKSFLENNSRDGWQTEASIREVFKQGVGHLRNLIDDPGEGDHVVPLSGGLDSRAILGVLLDRLSADRVTAITCGIPGTLDFEIGHQVADFAGIEVTTVDLSALTWKTGALVDFAAEIGQPVVIFDAYMYSRVLAEGGGEPTYWSGFMGDPLAGSHLRKKAISNWEAARLNFAESNEFAFSRSLTSDEYHPEAVLPKDPIAAIDVLSASEQLDFVVRQWDFIRPQVLLDGYEIKAPFLNPDWVQFILSIPDAYRRNQRAYKKILQEAYPDLFSLPVKSNVGLPLDASPLRKHSKRVLEFLKRMGRRLGVPGLGVDPRLNYIDVSAAIRSGSLRSVVHENLVDLQKRDLISWVDIEEIWKEHQSGRADHANALDVLTSLEIHLKAGTFDA